jgi:hypothetical protein
MTRLGGQAGWIGGFVLPVDDLADLEDRAALAAHLADEAARRGGIGLEDLDAALDRIGADRIS